jgi:SAM-dependent methyltransferase
MIERLLEHRLLTTCAYTAVDASPENIAEFQSNLPAWAENRELTASHPEPGRITLKNVELELDISVIPADVFSYLAHCETPGWDVLIAHAFLDLVDLERALPPLLGALKSGGIFYFSINFDGLTVLEPEADPLLDDLVLQLYHASMDNRRVAGRAAGSSRTGRLLLTKLREHGAQVLTAGGSDWVVVAGPSGYPDDEAFFLHFIMNTIELELADHPALDRKRFDRWIATRRQQIEEGDLVYIAHQIDVLGKIN